MLEELKQTVWQANLDLVRHGLVVGTSGNVSGRDPETGLVVIKPSGVPFENLEAADMSVVDEHGTPVEGPYKPSVDTLSHTYVYRTRPDVQGVAHTHSPFATSFATRGEPIAVYTTTHACLFGAPIPVSGYAVIGEEQIGKEIIATVGDGSAVLMRSHGVFTIGSSPQQALRAAMYTEECAELAHIALLRGPLEPLSDDAVASMREWYVSGGYGQSKIGAGA